jgi:HD superfamily phosphohydrolase
LKGISELGLCNILRTHREKEALRLTEKEIERRLRNLPNEILDRYKERASAQLPEFLKFAEREFSHREAQKHISKIKKNDRGNTLEI